MKAIVALLLFSICAPLSGQTLTDIRWMSEQFAPFNYQDEAGHARGIAVDLLIKAASNLEGTVEPDQIAFMPWARSYRTLKDTKNTALFVMVKTPTRATHFHFAGPIAPIRLSIIAPKASSLKALNKDDLNNHKIGVVRDDIGHHRLIDIGIDEDTMVLASFADQLIRMLENGRVDAIAYVEDVAYWNMSQLGINSNDYEVVLELYEDSVWFAFNKESDQHLIDTFQAEIDRLRTSGAVDAIKANYLQPRSN